MSALLTFATNRWAQLVVAAFAAFWIGMAEGCRRTDATAQLKAKDREIARLEASERVSEWARQTSVAVSRRIDQAQKREIETREAAEEETRKAVIEADDWERQFLEEKRRADDALRAAADATSKVNADAGKPPAPPIVCPAYSYSDAERRRLQQRLPGRSNRPSNEAHPSGHP